MLFLTTVSFLHHYYHNSLDSYDFIAVTERMDESLIIWKILFHLDYYDILFLKARSSGTFSNGPSEKSRPCVYLVPSFLTPTMQEFFESKEWKDSNAVDIMLYQAIYQSLDNTIEAVGKDLFQKQLSIFRQAKTLAEEFCDGKVRGTCTSGGLLIPVQNRTCVIWGEGCDYQCLQEFRKKNMLRGLLQQNTRL
jgi:hypothetical protein